MAESFDAVVIGSGPNGLAAALTLARAGRSVCVLEAAAHAGGGLHSLELTEPGFVHDLCSAVHPLGALSPFLSELPLHEHGLSWAYPPLSVAHPLDDGDAVCLQRDVSATAAELGADARGYTRLFQPFLAHAPDLLHDVLGPLRWPRRPLALARFGFYGMRSARGLARGLFADERTRALFAGCAAHSILPLERMPSAAVGLLFALTGHLVDWPVAVGGSGAIARAMLGLLQAWGGELRTGTPVTRLDALPSARAYLFDLAPRQLLQIAGDALPAGYARRLARYDYGPGVFKLDYALSGPIPWRDPRAGQASTVHVGGTLDQVSEAETAPWRGQHAERPFVMVCQQSHFDSSRAPAGKHTGYAYCHVPFGSSVDMTERIERQIERFAPGFRDVIVARRAHAPADLERINPALVGGVIAGGAAGLSQLFTRPVARLDPYTTPNPKLFLCSAATPPGGGVHGMCGHHAARSALRRALA
jgi:phytoene dehydrogenase-like protein